MNYLDIIILIILALGVISGVRKGLIISILNIVSIVVTFIICFSLTTTLSKLVLKYTNVASSINSIVSERINSLDPLTAMIINKLKISGVSPDDFLTIGFINVATFIVLFLGITIIMSFLKQGIRKGIKKSLLGPIDSLLGGILGFVKWVLILMVVFAFITPTIPLVTSDNQFYMLIKGSFFAKTFINYNFITTLIKGFIDGNIKSMITM